MLSANAGTIPYTCVPLEIIGIRMNLPETNMINESDSSGIEKYDDVVLSDLKGEYIAKIPPVINEAKEMIDDAEMEDDINKNSAEYAYKFLELVLKRNKYTDPYLDLHPNGNAMVVFSTENGILTVVFNSDDIVSYAAYFANTEETNKGSFKLSDDIPRSVHMLIERLS